MNVKRKICTCIVGLCAMLLLFAATESMEAAPSVVEINGGPVKLIYDYIGNYELNYTGNTNHYDYWDDSGTYKIVSRNYKDRTDLPIATTNNSTATISKIDSKSKIVKAYLIWETKSEKGVTEPIALITPNNHGEPITAAFACKDSRTNNTGQEYAGVYTMATDVTSIVCGENGGYGTYTVANIPVWEGAGIGVTCGGESVASWQLVVVEESPDFPLRTISLNLMSQYFFNVDYTIRVDFADAAAPNGVVSASFIQGLMDITSIYLYDGIGYKDDFNYEYGGNYFRYFTQTRGLYKNGVCINNRDTGSVYQMGSSAIGATRVHLFDDVRRKNSVGSESIMYKYAGTNFGGTTFLYGVAIDIFAYDIIFDGNGATGGSMENLSCVYGRGYNLPASGYTKQYYEFAGWNTKPDGGGKAYSVNAYIKNLTSTESSVTLYAQWKPAGYTISLDNQYATAPGTSNYFEWYGIGNYTDSKCTNTISKIKIPTKKSHTFGGYYTGTNGTGIQYVKPDGTITATSTTFEEDTTLYAKWNPNVYKITLDNQNATSAGTTQFYQAFDVGNFTTKECTTLISKITTPKKTHYSFGGYYTEKGGEGNRIIDENGNILEAYTLFEKDTTLYAFWEPVTYTITLDNQEATTVGDKEFYEKYGVKNYLETKKTTVLEEKRTDTFSYTGSVQTFIAPYDGWYHLEAYGAQGSSMYANGFLGGTGSGDIYLEKNEVLYVYVGGQPAGAEAGFNGGGAGGVDPTIGAHLAGGGGATDFRKGGTGLDNRILIAGGGGGSTAYVGKTFGLDEENDNKVGWTTAGGWMSHNMWLIIGDWGVASSYVQSTVRVEGTDSYVIKPSENVVYNHGTLGQGAMGCGGGWHGGGYAAYPIAGNIQLCGGGTGYIGGVENGDYAFDDTYKTIDAYSNKGHGKAYITYTDYSSSMEYIETTSVTIPKKTGYRFVGYYTKQNGNGTCYIDESGNILSTPTTFTEDTTLYAHWILDISDTYKIAFHGNGATEGSMSIMTCTFGEKYNLNKNDFARRGYRFAEWNTKEDRSGDAYQDQANVYNLANKQGDVVTLYAQWIPNEYVIQFDANGGTGYMDAVPLVYDCSVKLPANIFEKNNEYGKSIFLGWNVVKDTQEVLYRDSAEVWNLSEYADDVVTLYAIWDDCPWIEVTDQYYTLHDAKNGFITYDELMCRARAFDKEDGDNIEAGIDLEKGTVFTIIDYQPSDFTMFISSGSVTQTYQVTDTKGNVYNQRITVYIVDTEPKTDIPIGTTRFISEVYYEKPYIEGGLEEHSIWKIDSEYNQLIREAFANAKNDTPIKSYYFTHSDVVNMK